MLSLTVEKLKLYFENRLRQIDRYPLGNNEGKKPYFPMLVVFLGDEAIKGFSSVGSNLFEIWPQYQRELQFVGVTYKGNSAAYVKLSFEEDEVQKSQILEDDVRKIGESLFGPEYHFGDRSRLCVYFILNTESYKSAEEFSTWLDILQQTKNILGRSLDILDILIVLLHDTPNGKFIADQIRNRLYYFYEEPKLLGNCQSIFLLSNIRNDGVYFNDWSKSNCYRIASSIIALSNNSDATIIHKLFSRRILTASYAREEKPSDKIGQVIVTTLIDKMEKAFVSCEMNLFEDDYISERLGLTKDGTIKILDEYVQKELDTLLPSDSQLRLFPRKSADEYDDFSQFTAHEFNLLTMNSWDKYLEQVAHKVQEKVNKESKIREIWRTEYVKYLCEHFSTCEMIYLSDHIDDVRKLITPKREPSQEVPILSAAKTKLKNMLSSDLKLSDIFLSTIKEQGEKARKFLQTWRELLQSRQNIFPICDDNITAFYERKVRDYFDHCGSELTKEFEKMQESESLKLFLEKSLDKIVDRNPVVSASFEEELEKRLREEATLSTDAKQYIRQKLIDKGVLYLQTNSNNLGQPVLSSILIKAGTPLYENLRSNLPRTTYYYNTGCGNAAEAMTVYEVSKENLINGEGR